MSQQTEDEIIDDILDYLRNHESVCIQTERQSGLNWVREHDGEWQLAKHTNQGTVSASTVEEGTVKAVLKTNYYRLIPTRQAQTDTGREVWKAVEDDE